MKKHILFLAIASFAFVSFAQTPVLPDGSFENWKEATAPDDKKFNDIAGDFWQTLNFVYSLPADLFTGPLTTFKSEGRVAGTFCPKLVSAKMELGATEEEKETIFLPGVIGNITVIFEEQTAEFGRSFVARPDSLKGWFKYTPVNGDSAEIYVDMMKDGMVFGSGSYKVYDTVESWKEFSLGIRYWGEGNSDSITILCVSSAGYNFVDLFECQGQVGSTLFVDDLTLVYKGGISIAAQAEKADFRLYPNPAKDVLHIQSSESLQGAIMTIFDMSGRSVKQSQLQGTEQGVDVSRLQNGLYTYRVVKNNSILSNGKFTVVR